MGKIERHAAPDRRRRPEVLRSSAPVGLEKSLKVQEF
jgi:hypothetical protein